jgi:hypothetical protein
MRQRKSDARLLAPPRVPVRAPQVKGSLKRRARADFLRARYLCARRAAVGHKEPPPLDAALAAEEIDGERMRNAGAARVRLVADGRMRQQKAQNMDG